MTEAYQPRPSPFRREAPTPDTRGFELLKTLEDQVAAVQDDESFRAWLDVQSRFHQYSFGNTGLIMAQRPDATAVAGFRKWQTMNRFVKKGEKGIRIMVPMHRKEENPVTGDE